MALPDPKKAKYLNAISEWRQRDKHTLEDTRKLYGKLLYMCHIISQGRAYLTNFEKLMETLHKRPFTPHHQPKPLVEDLTWWQKILTRPSLSCDIPVANSSLTSVDSPMQAHPLAWALSLVADGGLGDSSQIGRKQAEISDGQRSSPWNYSSELLSSLIPLPDSKSFATTSESSRAGGLVGVVTPKPTGSSDVFTDCWKNMVPSSPPDTSARSTIPRTAPQEESSSRTTYYSPHLSSHPSLNTSSLTLTLQSNSASGILLEAFFLNQSQSYPGGSNSGERKRTASPTTSQNPLRKTPCLVSVLTKPTSPSPTQLMPTLDPSNDSLALKPSLLRPITNSAGDRLRLWKPTKLRHDLNEDGKPTNLRKQDLARIQDILEDTYAPSTQGTYGTGLWVFHAFCDLKDIQEDHRAPVDPTVLSSFVAHMVGTYGSYTIRNYVYGVQAWHIIHGAK